MAWESWVRGHIDEGELIVVLEEYCPPFPGLFLYSATTAASPPLRAFIGHIRRTGEESGQEAIPTALACCAFPCVERGIRPGLSGRPRALHAS